MGLFFQFLGGGLSVHDWDRPMLSWSNLSGGIFPKAASPPDFWDNFFIGFLNFVEHWE